MNGQEMHQVGLTDEQWPGGTGWRGVCSCGWQSGVALTADQARALGDEHRSWVARGYNVVVSEAGAFRVPDCPSWCTQPSGHELTSELAADHDGAVTRVHLATMSTSSAIEVSAAELIGRGDADFCDSPRIQVVGEAVERGLTVAQAREVAGALLEAVALIEQITLEGQPSAG